MAKYHCSLCDTSHHELVESVTCPECGRIYCQASIDEIIEAEKYGCPYCGTPLEWFTDVPIELKKKIREKLIHSYDEEPLPVEKDLKSESEIKKDKSKEYFSNTHTQLQIEEQDSQIHELEIKARMLSDKYLVQKARMETISSFLKSEEGKENPAVSFITTKVRNGDIQGVLGEFQNLSDEGEHLPTEVGHLSDAIVTDSIDTALSCIQLLKDNAVGAANFIPLEKFKLKPKEKFSNVVKKVREKNEVVNNLRQAANKWRKREETVSTVDGDVFFSNGIILGGFHIAAAQETVDELRVEVNETLEQRDAITRELRAIKKEKM